MSEYAPFFGREQELASLEQSFLRALDGTQQLVFVEGEAGIGKTALLTRFARNFARDPRARVFHLTAPQGELFRPLHQAALAATNHRLYSRLGGKRQAGDVVRSVYVEWLNMIPVFGSLIAAIVGTVEKVKEWRTPGQLPTGATLDDDIAALIAASRRKPLILLIDDLEEADEAEVGRLEKLIRIADENARILIVGAYRPAGPASHTLR